MPSSGCHVNGAKVKKLDPRTVYNFFFLAYRFEFGCKSKENIGRTRGIGFWSSSSLPTAPKRTVFETPKSVRSQ